MWLLKKIGKWRDIDGMSDAGRGTRIFRQMQQTRVSTIVNLHEVKQLLKVGVFSI